MILHDDDEASGQVTLRATPLPEAYERNVRAVRLQTALRPEQLPRNGGLVAWDVRAGIACRAHVGRPGFARRTSAARMAFAARVGVPA
eukprot:scaffold7207_cov520-Prasinococcus_capsulatus_cf.AAC.11